MFGLPVYQAHENKYYDLSDVFRIAWDNFDMYEEMNRMNNSFEFYRDRLLACPSYGFKSGHEILELVLRCAGRDSSLTAEEYNSIIKQADLCHIKMMEDNYNEGWS